MHCAVEITPSDPVVLFGVLARTVRAFYFIAAAPCRLLKADLGIFLALYVLHFFHTCGLSSLGFPTRKYSFCDV